MRSRLSLALAMWGISTAEAAVSVTFVAGADNRISVTQDAGSPSFDFYAESTATSNIGRVEVQYPADYSLGVTSRPAGWSVQEVELVGQGQKLALFNYDGASGSVVNERWDITPVGTTFEFALTQTNSSISTTPQVTITSHSTAFFAAGIFASEVRSISVTAQSIVVPEPSSGMLIVLAPSLICRRRRDAA